MQTTKFLMILALAGAWACHQEARQTAHPTEEGKHAHEAHWGYEGEAGPDHWGEVAPLCKEGHEQSPVDLDAAPTHGSKELRFHYQASKLDVVNNGHTIQVNVDPGSFIEVGEARYELAQFHVHTPSEHALHGRLLGGEVHLVHKDAQGHLAVVGVWLDEDSSQEHDALDALWSHLLTEPGEVKFDDTVEPLRFLPSAHKAFHYRGSLTTPPCSEGVEWFVMEAPIKVSPAHLEAFARIFHHNNRPVQPLYGRAIEEDEVR